MMINIPGKMGKITNTNADDRGGKKINKANKIIYSPIGNQEIEENFSSSDSEFMSYLDSERNLICLKQHDAVLKKKEVSGYSAHKLSNFILHKRKTPFDTNSSGASVSNSFINMNNTCSMRNIPANDRVAPVAFSHDTSEIRCDYANKVSQSVYVPRLRLPVYKVEKKQKWIDLYNNKGHNANNTNSANCIYTNMIDINDCCDLKNLDKSELILRGDQDFYVKKRKLTGTKIVQEHGNADNDTGGRIDLTPHMKYNIRHLRKEKLSEIVLIQSFWRSSALRKRRKIMTRIILIQSVWRGHWLRIILYNSIFRYYSGRAFLKHVKRVNDINRMKVGKIFFENLKKFEKSEVKNDVLLVYNKIDKIKFRSNLNQNLYTPKINYFSDRYNNNEDNTICYNDEEKIFMNNEFLKNKSFGDKDLLIDSSVEIGSQFQFEEEDEVGYDGQKIRKEKNVIETETQNFSKLEVIREYLENKINSIELIHNDSFNITSSINQIKKFDNLLEEFNSFTIEINKLAESTSNLLENATNVKYDIDSLKFQNKFKQFSEEKLLRFEADRFDINREYERMKNNFSKFDTKNKENSEMNNFPLQYYQENREQPDMHVKNIIANPNLSNLNELNTFKASDFNYDNNSMPDIERFLHNAKQATRLIKVFEFENVENFELLRESSTKCSLDEKSHFDLQKAHDLYYHTGNELDSKRERIDSTTQAYFNDNLECKSLEVVVECSFNYNSFLRNIEMEKVYNINYSPIIQESQIIISTTDDKYIQTDSRELEISEIKGIFFESINKKILFEVYKENEIFYANTPKDHHLEMKREYDITFTYSPKIISYSMCNTENGNYLGQDRTKLYEITFSVIELVYSGVKLPSRIKLEIQKENEVNYMSFPKAKRIHLGVSKEYDFVYSPTPKVSYNNISKELNLIYPAKPKITILKNIKENEICYYPVDKLETLKEVKQSIDLTYEPTRKINKLEISSLVYSINHTAVKRSFDIVNVSELLINKLKKPELAKCTAYDILIHNQRLEKSLSEETFSLQLINHKQPNQASHLEEFTINRIRQFTFDHLSHHSDVESFLYEKVKKISLIDACVSLEIQKVKKKENIISDNEINLSYNNTKGLLIKNIFLKNSNEIFKKISASFFKWRNVIRELSSKQRENLIKNIFCLRSIYNLINTKNFNQIKRRFSQWRLMQFQISNKLIAAIVVKKITNVIDKNIKSSVFEDLIHNLNCIRIERIKKDRVNYLLGKLHTLNHIRLLKEFNKWKLLGLKLHIKEKLLRLILSKTSKKISQKKILTCTRIWKSSVDKQNKIIKSLYESLNSIIIKNYLSSKIKCFDQLKIFYLILESNDKLKSEKLKNILKNNDNRNNINLKFSLDKFRNIMSGINRKENIYLKNKIDLINSNNQIEIKLMRILKNKDITLSLELSKRITTWKNFTLAIKKKNSIVISKKSCEIEYIHQKRLTEEKEVSFDYKDYLNYSIEGIKYFEYIPDKTALGKLKQNLFDVSLSESLELICPHKNPMYEVQTVYEIQHVYEGYKYNYIKQADTFEIESIINKEDSSQKGLNTICKAESTIILNEAKIKNNFILVHQIEITVLPISKNEMKRWLIASIISIELEGLVPLHIITSESTVQTEERRSAFESSQVYSLAYCSKIEFSSKGVNTEIGNNYVAMQVYQIDYSTTNRSEDVTNKNNLVSESICILRKSCLLFKFLKTKENNYNTSKLEFLLKWRHISPLLSDRREDRTGQISRRAISTVNQNITHSTVNNNTSSVDMISFVSNTDEDCEEFTEEEIEEVENEGEEVLETEDVLETEEVEESEEDEVIIENIKTPRIVKRQLILKSNNQRSNHSIYTIKNFHTLPNGDEVEYNVKNKIYSIFVKYECPLLYYFNKWLQNKTKLSMKYNIDQNSNSSENEISIHPYFKITKKSPQNKLKNLRQSIRQMKFSSLAKINMNLGYYFSKWKIIVNNMKSYAICIKRQFGLKKAFLKWKKLSEENFASVSYHHSRSLSYRTDEESVHIIPNMVTVLQKLRIFNSVNKTIEPRNIHCREIDQQQFYLDDIINESFEAKSSSKEETKRVKEKILKNFVPNRTKSFCFQKWKTICKQLKKNDYARMKLLSLEYIRRKVIKKCSLHKWKKHIVVLKINKIKIESRQQEDNLNQDEDSVIKVQKIHVIKVDKKSGKSRPHNFNLNLNVTISNSSSISGNSHTIKVDKYNFNNQNRDTLSIRFMKILNLLDKVIYKSTVRSYFSNWRRMQPLIDEKENISAKDSSDEEASFTIKLKPMIKVNNNLNDATERVFSSNMNRDYYSNQTDKSIKYPIIKQSEFIMSFDKSTNESKAKSELDMRINNLSDMKFEFIGDLIRKVTFEKYSFLIKTSIDAFYKNFNKLNSFKNLTKRFYIDKLKVITINLLLLNVITKIQNEKNPLSLKRAFYNWFKNTFIGGNYLEEHFSNNGSTRELIPLYNKQIKSLEAKERWTRLNLAISKILSKKVSRENQMLYIYFNKIRSNIKKQILSDKADLLITQAKKYLISKNRRIIKSLKLDNLTFTDSIYFPTNRMPNLRDSERVIYSERKTRNNNYIHSPPINRSEKILKSKTNFPDCFKKKFPDILDNSVDEANFLKSSLSIENEEDDCIIISAIQIQSAWRYYKQKTYLINYSIWLKVLKKMIKRMGMDNKTRMQLALVNWRKVNFYFKLIEAINLIKDRYASKLKQKESKLVMVELCKARRLKRMIKIISARNSSMTLSKHLLNWKNSSAYIKRASAADYIKSKLKRYIQRKKLKSVLLRAYHQSIFKAFLLFADAYNYNDRVSYLSYVLVKTKRRLFYKCLIRAKFDKIVMKQLNHLNEINLTESRRDILKLWLRKMKLLRRKDHLTMKMLRIIKLNVKYTVILALKLNSLINNIDKYKKNLLGSLFYRLKEILEQ